MLYFSNDRQTAGEVFSLAFQYARAEAQLIAKTGDRTDHSAIASPSPTAAGTIPGRQGLEARKQAAEQAQKLAGQKLKALQQMLASAHGQERRKLLSEVAAAKSEYSLADARADAFESIVRFETANSIGTGHQGAGLLSEIDELQHSVPEVGSKSRVRSASSTTPKALRHAEPSGIIRLAQDLLVLDRKTDVLTNTIALTQSLADTATQLRAPLISELGQIQQRGSELAAESGTTNLAHLQAQQQAFDALLRRHKLLVAAVLPLTEESVALHSYIESLKRWRNSIGRQSDLEFKSLIIRLSVLVFGLAVLFIATLLWRTITFRYVKDIRRRHQFLQARRLVLAVGVLLILMFNFASELGALATVVGFAAAGIALALQNVLLSIAGYFFLIGKYGISVGDRVELAGVTGDVVDIGLVKLSLMELSGAGNDRQPSGRVVVFSNAIVFQPNGNFFKQAQGTNFIWYEVSLTLAPDCDYRLAEERLLEAVDEVFARYRDSIERQYREIEKNFHMTVEMPRPQSRMELSREGLMVVIRYPVETANAARTADEVNRRLLDAISREPTLKLVGQTTPNIQPVTRTAEADGGVFAAK